MTEEDNARLFKKFEISVAGELYNTTLEEDLEIDKQNLSDEFAEHAIKYAWYSWAYEVAVDHAARLKNELARIEAQEDYKARTHMELAKVKITETKVKNTVITSAPYVACQKKLEDAQLQVGIIKAARDAMQHRKDMLISLGANIRAEMNADPFLREK